MLRQRLAKIERRVGGVSGCPACHARPRPRVFVDISTDSTISAARACPACGRIGSGTRVVISETQLCDADKKVLLFLARGPDGS